MSISNMSIHQLGNKFFLKVHGKLNEDTDFSKVDLSAVTEVIVDFNDVTQIQSCGVREWLRLVKPYKNIVFVYIYCPKIIVDQINLVDGFLPRNSRVESFFVPYYCEKNDESYNILYKYGRDFDHRGLLCRQNISDKEGHELEIDVVEERYFRFLNKEQFSLGQIRNPMTFGVYPNAG